MLSVTVDQLMAKIGALVMECEVLRTQLNTAQAEILTMREAAETPATARDPINSPS